MFWLLVAFVNAQQTIVEPTIQQFPKKYIISLNTAISEQEWIQHNKTLHQVMKGEFGYNLTEIGRILGASDTLLAKIPTVDKEIVKSSLQLSKGFLGQFNISSTKGYHGQFPDWVIDIIKQVPIIEFIEEDVNVSIQQGPKGYFNFDSSATDIQINPSWGLDRVSHRETGFEGRYIYPKDAGQDVDIYIADTGVRIDHDDLKGRAIFGVSYSNDGDEDRQGHGTHVAAIAAGTTFGIAKKANIISVKVLNNKGAGPASAVIKGIEWIIRRAKTTGRRSVVNLSLGGGQVSNALNAVVAAAVAQDIVFSVAAGNQGKDACNSSPQNSELVITVGASDQKDQVAPFSNFGPCVNIFAPGVNITSASFVNADSTRTISGTSQAAPLVAGQIAILLRKFPTLKPKEVLNALQGSATTGKLSGLRPGEPDFLLFNGIPTKELKSTLIGTNFGINGGGWTLVKQIMISAFL